MTGKLLTAEELEVLRERYSAPIWDKVGLDHRPLLAHVDALQVERDAFRAQLEAKPPRYCKQCGDGTGYDHTVTRMSEVLRASVAKVNELQAQIDAERGTVGSFKAALRREREDRKTHARNVGRLAEMHFAARHLLAWQQARCLMFDEDAARHIWLAAGKSVAEIWRADNERLRAENARLASERDAARAEVQRLRGVLGDVLAGWEQKVDPIQALRAIRVARAALSEREVRDA